MEDFLSAATDSQSWNRQMPRQKRRHQKPRVLFSCNTCRKDKLKCDRGKPCTTCLKRNRETSCTYSPGSLSRANTTGSSIYDGRLRSLDGRLRSLENKLSQTNPAWLSPVSPMSQYTDPDPSSAQATSTTSLRSAPLCDSSQTECNLNLFTNTTHWRAIMSDATKELERGSENDNNRTGDRQQRNCKGPALLTGFFNEMIFAEHFGMLPPREITDALVYRCLDSVEPFLISVHAPTFKHEYLEFWKRPEDFTPAWISLLYAVLSCSVWMNHTTDPNAAGLQLPKDFDFYRKQSAAFLAKSDIAIPGRHKVEAAVVYLGIEYVRTDNLKTDVSVLLGLVSRLAIVSGYHRDTQMNSQITTFEAEMRRRSWLVLLVTDCVVAYETGLPRAIASGLGDVRRPRNLLDEDFGPSTPVLPPARNASKNCNRISYMLKMESILSMAADIADSSPGLATLPERTAKLSQGLEAIRDSIPAILRIPSAGSSISDEKMAIWRSNLEITYQRTRCTLHRPFLRYSLDPQTRFFRETCVSAAQRILELEIEIFQVFWRKSQNHHRVWFGASRCVSDGLTAAMVISLELIYRTREQQLPNFVASDELIQLLKGLYVGWKCAPKLSPEVDKAAKILAVMLHQMGIHDPGRCFDDADPSLRTQDYRLGSVPHMASVINKTEDFPSPENPIYELLNISSMEDMFDWALWDHEMHLLDKSTT